MRRLANRGLAPGEKRRTIFDAARQVIAERGFDRATMEEIATCAGVGKGTLYNFFSSKEELFLSLVLDGFEQTRDLIDAEVEQARNPWEEFEVAWRTLMLKVFPELADRWNFNYQLWGFLARDPAARDRLFASWRDLYREREERISSAIAEGQRGGHFRADLDPRSVALLLMAVFDGLLHRATFDGDRIDPERTLQGVLTLVGSALAPHSP